MYTSIIKKCTFNLSLLSAFSLIFFSPNLFAANVSIYATFNVPEGYLSQGVTKYFIRDATVQVGNENVGLVKSLYCNDVSDIELTCSGSIDMKQGNYFVWVKADAAKQEDFSSAPVSYRIEISSSSNKREKVIQGTFKARSNTVHHNSTRGAKQVGQFKVN